MRATSLLQSAANTASANLPAIDANQLVNASFLITQQDAGGAGTVQIQFSNDIVTAANLFADFTFVNWVNVPGSTATATVAAGAAVAVYIPQGFTARAYRIAFTRTGGTTTFTSYMYAQSV